MGKNKVQILLIGDENCGKTSLIMRYLNDMYVDSKLEHEESRLKDMSISDKPIEVQLLEFKQSEYNEEQTVSVFRTAHALVFLFSAEDGMDVMVEWMGFVDRFVTGDKLWFIIQTKTDLGSTSLPLEQRNTFTFKHTFNEYFEVSAKDDINVHHTLDTIIQTTIKKFLNAPESTPQQSNKKEGCVLV
ncbi:GTP-binding protein EhRabX29 [Entamoeba marina]